MDILFKTDKLAKRCNNTGLRLKECGEQRAKLIGRRLDQLHAAVVLQDLWNAPGRCHELKEDRDGELTLDLDGPYRLVFEVADDPVPRKADGGLDWTGVTAVRILGMENTHE